MLVSDERTTKNHPQKKKFLFDEKKIAIPYENNNLDNLMIGFLIKA